jgi:predicted metallopeptidase
MSSSANVLRGFNFTLAMRQLCADMAARLSALRHVQMERVAVGFCQTRRNVSHGMQASLTPLRFARGATSEERRRGKYACPRLVRTDGVEYLYLLNFYLPRFQNQPFEEKLTTVAHELWHIGPNFDGDLRRHPGRCYAHGSSQQAFDAHAAGLAREWLRLDPPPACYEFLRANFRQLFLRYDGVFGERFATPKLVAL